MEAPTEVGSGEGAVALPRKTLACSPLKWCVLMHSGARFRPNYNCHYDVHDISRGLVKIMKITVCAMRIISTLKPAKTACINY